MYSLLFYFALLASKISYNIKKKKKKKPVNLLSYYFILFLFKYKYVRYININNEFQKNCFSENDY